MTGDYNFAQHRSACGTDRCLDGHPPMKAFNSGVAIAVST
jgi:hypothetical protein